MAYYLVTWRTELVRVAIVGGAVLVAIAAHRAIFALAKRGVRHRVGQLSESIVHYRDAPSQLILPLLAVIATLPWLTFTNSTAAKVSHGLFLLLIGSLGWLGIGVLNAFENFVSRKYAVEAGDNITSRQLRTQVHVLRHIAVIVVVVVTLATMLMTFLSIRHIGESLFASAGLAAVVAGLAARTALTNLLAGVQIAITQPIRLEDAVVVEGESGWIEQITTTYVVVRIWDLRRPGGSTHLLHREALSELDPSHCGPSCHSVCLHRLQCASGRRSPGVARNPASVRPVGW